MSSTNPSPKVVIVMGSKSDLECMQVCIDVLKSFKLDVTVKIMSAHRTPAAVHDFFSVAEENGYEIVIAAAGKAAHLGGVVASLTTIPVIGVPMKTSDLGGMDSLLSTVQMPTGIPVATVAIGTAGAGNAGHLAAQILALKYPHLKTAVKESRVKMAEKVLEANDSLEY